MSDCLHLDLPICQELIAGASCWLCKPDAGSERAQVHPVDAYRHWDRMWGWENRGTKAHWSTVWLLSSAFLEAYGFKLETAVVDCPRYGRRLVTPHEFFTRGWRFELSTLVCPGTDAKGNGVFIKSVNLHRSCWEYPVNCILNSAVNRKDSRNHAVPLLDILHFQPDFRDYGRDYRLSDMRAFLVMPKLAPLDLDGLAKSDIQTTTKLKKCMDFAVQISEGLTFMHKLGVFHGDISEANMVVAGAASDTPTYYYIDFQGSCLFPRPWRHRPRMKAFFSAHLRFPAAGASAVKPFDPFPTDVYALGIVLRSLQSSLKFRPDYEACSKSLPGFGPLIDQMLHENPKQRPTASQAATSFKDMRQSLDDRSDQPQPVSPESSSDTPDVFAATLNLRELEQLPMFSFHRADVQPAVCVS